MRHPPKKSSFISLVILASILALIAFPVATIAAPARAPDIAAIQIDTERNVYVRHKIDQVPAYIDYAIAAAGDSQGTIASIDPYFNYMSGLATMSPPATEAEVMRVGVMSVFGGFDKDLPLHITGDSNGTIAGGYMHMIYDKKQRALRDTFAVG